MLTLSKPISAGQAQAYHKSEFANAKENYYTEGERVRGEWQGQLATRYGLRGEVNEEQFARPDGKLFDHVEKLEQFAAGLDRQAKHLERVLQRSGLSESQAGRVTKHIEDARGGLRAIQRATGGGGS